MQARHQDGDYDFADDAVYVVNLKTGVPVVLDIGAGNFNYTLRQLDKYWANDTRVTERNLLWETIDESQDGAITADAFSPEHDTDFDGVLDVPNLDDPRARRRSTRSGRRASPARLSRRTSPGPRTRRAR
jgi:hypothetical protein